MQHESDTPPVREGLLALVVIIACLLAMVGGLGLLVSLIKRDWFVALNLGLFLITCLKGLQLAWQAYQQRQSASGSRHS